MLIFGDWRYSLNRDATLEAYQAIEHGGSEACECAGCRNFVLARPRVFPASFLLLLNQLGIDPLKDAEVHHIAQTLPGQHEYGGWFHFVGALHKTGDFPPVALNEDFSVWMCSASAPRLDSLTNAPVVQLEFHAESVPWLVADPEP